MRLSVSKCVLFWAIPAGRSCSKWQNISIEILKIEINVKNPFRDLKMIKKVFWQILDKKQNADRKGQP